MSVTIDEVVAESGSKGRVTAEVLKREILSDAKIAYAAREEKLGSPAMRELERRVVLQVLDRRWRDHLYEMDYLKDGIGLRAMAQRDPLIEYQREGYQMFQAMMGQIKEESVGFLYNLDVEVRATGDGQVEAKGLQAPPVEAQKLQYTAAGADGQVEVRNDRGQVQQAATSKVRQQAAAAVAPQQQPAAEAPRGAFGQKTDAAASAPAAAPQNRAQRRAADRKK
ncbi:hypothetical protein [Microbacterium aurum]